MNTKFFTYRQNNPGGYVHINEKVGEYLIIEAHNVEEANNRLDIITEGYDDNCYCGICSGDRWNKYSTGFDEDEGKEAPMIHDVEAENFRYKGIFDNDDLRKIIIYYMDDTVKHINY